MFNEQELEERYLRYHFPELNNSIFLGLSVVHAQIGANMKLKKNLTVKPVRERPKVRVEDYQSEGFVLIPRFEKPVSKIFLVNKITDESE